jgi:hypothetical protein
MATTTVKSEDGVEVILSDSRTRCGACAITIVAPTPERIALVAMWLMDEYGAVEITDPEQCADGRWGSFGIIG